MHNLRGVELSFWGKMRPAAQEAALQLVLRDGSKEIVGEGQHVRSWGRRDSEQSGADLGLPLWLSW